MKNGNLSQTTAKKLLNMFREGKEFKPGCKLPNENELSLFLGVSRGTLRESIKLLCAQGVLIVKRGSGTYVADELPKEQEYRLRNVMDERAELKSLYEARLMTEPQCAALACRRASREEIAEIEKNYLKMAEAKRHGEDSVAADLAFHRSIIQATHNDILMQFIPSIHRSLDTAAEIDAYGIFKDYVTDDHKMILEFIKAGDSVGAENAARMHILHLIQNSKLPDDGEPIVF